MREGYIYGLVDPRDNEIKYIGKTLSKLNIRLNAHINDKKQSKKQSWIKHLKDLSLLPTIILLDTCNEKDCYYWEQWWIQVFKSWGFELKNLTDGGPGSTGLKKSQEERKKMSEIRKGKRTGSDNHFYGKKHTEETKKKISEKSKGIKRSAEFCEKRRAYQKSINWKPSEKIRKLSNEIHGRRIIQLDLEGNFIKEWYMMSEAAQFIGIQKTAHIVHCCQGSRNTCKGYMWMYKENYNQENVKILIEKYKSKNKNENKV